MIAPIFVVVTGGRFYANATHVAFVLLGELKQYGKRLVIVQGECYKGGADKLASDWCDLHGVPCIGMRAAWTKFKRSAGHKRNGWMLDILKPIKVIAFPGDVGTQNCVDQARHRDIQVVDERGTVI